MKDRPSLLDWTFVGEMVARMTQGALKHPDADKPFYLSLTEQELTDGLLRHVMAYASGEKVDRETGQSHLIAIACRAMMSWDKQARVTDKEETEDDYDQDFSKGECESISRVTLLPCGLEFDHLGMHGSFDMDGRLTGEWP